MIGILVVTHGILGKSTIEAVELIAGEQENVRAIGLHHGDGVEELDEKIKTALIELEQGDGILAFVDFYGGTPANRTMQCMGEKKFRCIAGVNMPMLLEALTDRDDCSVEELECKCINAGKDSFVKLHEIYKKIMSGGN